MSDNRKVAFNLLNIANTTINKDRPGVHGSAENSFEMIADMWEVQIRHAIRVRLNVNVPRGFLFHMDVAQMMSTLKKARALYGDGNNADNFIDDLGYTALAGMLQLPDNEANRGELPKIPLTPKEEPRPVPDAEADMEERTDA